MPKTLNYSIIGLEDYTISFEIYCSLCEIQKFCKWGKEDPYSVKIRWVLWREGKPSSTGASFLIL